MTDVPGTATDRDPGTSPGQDKLLLRALRGETCQRPPIWLMRQAGRYLPEYRETRKQAGDFLDLCMNPELAVEVTLQPLRRYELDAAIMFSDILVLPLALGQKVWFEEGQGPKLTALESGSDLARLSPAGIDDTLAPVFEILRRLTSAIPAETALIGFAGAPWTVASYMLEGGSSRDFAVAKQWAYGRPDDFQALIDLLVDSTATYLIKQVEAGAEALQLFDSWAGVLPAPDLRRWCLDPAKRIVAKVKASHPEVPIILFPRNAGPLYLDFAAESGADALSLDTSLPVAWAREHLQTRLTVQGNLDPIAVVVGGAAMQRGTAEILETLGRGPFIFNLGHGLVPQTPPEHVAALAEQVKAWRA